MTNKSYFFPQFEFKRKYRVIFKIQHLNFDTSTFSLTAMTLEGSAFEEMFDLSPYLEMVQPIPAPIEVLGKICDQVSSLCTKIFLSYVLGSSFGGLLMCRNLNVEYYIILVMIF